MPSTKNGRQQSNLANLGTVTVQREYISRGGRIVYKGSQDGILVIAYVPQGVAPMRPVRVTLEA